MVSERRNDYREYALSDIDASYIDTDDAAKNIAEVTEHLVELTHNDLMRENQYREIEKTELQIEIANILIEAIRRTLEELDFDWTNAEATLSVEHIHVISDDTFYAEDVHPLWGGYHTNDGSIYLPEKTVLETTNFITTLAHEMAHEISYQEFGKTLAFVNPKRKKGIYTETVGPYSKSGIATRHDGIEYGRGYMEAVNELLSVEFCKRVSVSGVIPKDVKKTLGFPSSYLEQIFLLETIIDQAVIHEQEVSGRNDVDTIRKDIMKEIFSDHISGTYQFFDRLSEFWPKAIEALEEMSDTELESVIQMAEMLNLTTVADKIAARHELDVVRG